MAPSFADKALALAQCERDLDSAIERLLNLRLEPTQDSNEGNTRSDHGTDQLAAPAPAQTAAAAAAAAAETSLPFPSSGAATSGTEWVEMLVSETASASSMDDARSRAARLLGAFEGSVARKDQNQLEAVVKQNAILKRAVAVQHRRHMEHEHKCKELEDLVAQYRAQVRSLEVDKYVLSMRLRQAQQPGSSLPGRFHPEIF